MYADGSGFDPVALDTAPEESTAAPCACHSAADDERKRQFLDDVSRLAGVLSLLALLFGGR